MGSASFTLKTIVMPSSSMSRFLMGPCLSVIFPAASSIFLTSPLTVDGSAKATPALSKSDAATTAALNVLVFMVGPFSFICLVSTKRM
jgi:hypothetical protein